MRLTLAGKQLATGSGSVSNNGLQHLQTIDEVGGLSGGAEGFVRSKFTKTSDEMTLMKKKYRAAAAESLNIIDGRGCPPRPMLTEVLEPMRVALSTIRAMVELSDEDFELQAFKHLDEDGLKELVEILSRQGVKPEERLLMLSNVMVPSMMDLNKAEDEIKHMMLETHAAFIDAYTTRFAVMNKSATVVLNHAKLLEMLNNYLKIRKAMGKLTREPSSGAAAEDLDSRQGSCVLS